jgi:hypothetical protein
MTPVPEVTLAEWLADKCERGKLTDDQRKLLSRVVSGLDFKLGREPSLRDLCEQTEANLLCIPLVGRIVLQLVKSLLLSDGFHLGMEPKGGYPPLRPLLERLRLAPAHPVFGPLVKDAHDEIVGLRQQVDFWRASAQASSQPEDGSKLRRERLGIDPQDEGARP